MNSNKRVDYVNRTGIKLWNLYDDNIIAYFKKKFRSYLTEMGLFWLPFLHPKSIITVKNQQKKKTQFNIFFFDDQHNTKGTIEERFLYMDLNHLLFFDIADKDKEFKVLNQFNEILKPKNESNKILKLNETNLSFFLNPPFFLILYDSTNESGNFQPPETCSISLPSYSDLIITEQKHFIIQGFYEWLYKSTDRTSRVLRTDINPEILKFFKDQQKKSPVYEMSITTAHIARYEYDISLDKNDKSRLSQILNHFSRDDLKKIGRELKLTKIPIRKNQLINYLVDLSDQINKRDSIIRMCKEFLKNEVKTTRSKNKKFLTQIKESESNPLFEKCGENNNLA